MMKKIITLYILTLMLSSCNTNEDKVEMYLLKHHIKTSEGVPLLEIAESKGIAIDDDIKRLSKFNFDTISKTLIYGGKFSVTANDLEKEAFLNDSDFLSLKIDSSKFVFSENAKSKISKLETSTQFVITVNKKPIITGYFRYHYSSNILNWNYFSYIHDKSTIKPHRKPDFILFQNDGYDKWEPFKTNLYDYPVLLEAFKKSNRIEN